jgi:hypothetical protein
MTLIRPAAEALTEREARYADTAFQTWDGKAAAEGEWRGGTWGEVARAVIVLADEEIEARVFDDFKHTLSAKDAIIAEQTAKVVEGEDLIEHLHGVMDMQTEAQTEALKAIEGYAAERDDARATVERVKALAYAWAPFKDDGHPHWTGCHLVHADCFIHALRAALETPQT